MQRELYELFFKLLLQKRLFVLINITKKQLLFIIQQILDQFIIQGQV